MKTLNVLAAVFVFVAAAFTQQSLAPADLAPVEGGKWIGELTYLDYRSNKKTAIKSNLSVTKTSDNAWSFAYEYPDEPKANSTGEVTLSADGGTFNGQKVVSKHKLGNGGLEIVTEKVGEDNNKRAVFRYTYALADNSFSIRKDVRIDGTAEWFERNTYNWSRH